MPKDKKTVTSPNQQTNETLRILQDHYAKGSEDMEMRKHRKHKGWDSILEAYLNVLPGNWPYTSKVTDPRIRTTILEKTSRLLNGRLRGTLVPREGGDLAKARINNAILDYQWDNADRGGSMIEKVAKADAVTRIFGAAFALVYWDNEKDCNEIKIWDPRDVFIDYTADHIKSANWVQLREYTTIKELEGRGYNLSKVKDQLKEKYTVDRDNISIVKQYRGIEERTGQDPANPLVEVITEYTAKRGGEKAMRYVFLPRYNHVLEAKESPYQHQRIPVAMLRYYPLPDDVYGESEVEPVMSLQRAINAILCGFIDTMNLATRPPYKVLSGETRTDTMVFNPGARWIVNNINSGTEVQIGDSAIKAFNNTYPALVAAFNTAMGDSSLGVSNLLGKGEDKTATEVNQLADQQNSRDQYNQLYLGQFLKDIVLLWLENNRQYLFDDPTKQYRLFKIIGRDKIEELKQMGLADTELPDEETEEVKELILNQSGKVSPLELEELMSDLQVPRNPVIKNPEADPGDYDIVPKLDISDREGEADLYLTSDDLEGFYDYIPDVKSMAAGANTTQKQGRKEAFNMALNDGVQQGLAQEGQRLKISELVTTILEDAGITDANTLIEPIGPGPGIAGEGQLPQTLGPEQGLPGAPTLPVQPGGPGLAQPQGLQETGDPSAPLPI